MVPPGNSAETEAAYSYQLGGRELARVVQNQLSKREGLTEEGPGDGKLGVQNSILAHEAIRGVSES